MLQSSFNVFKLLCCSLISCTKSLIMLWGTDKSNVTLGVCRLQTSLSNAQVRSTNLVCVFKSVSVFQCLSLRAPYEDNLIMSNYGAIAKICLNPVFWPGDKAVSIAPKITRRKSQASMHAQMCTHVHTHRDIPCARMHGQQHTRDKHTWEE